MMTAKRPHPKQPRPTPVETEVLRSSRDLDRFNSVILARARYWSRQREICRSLETYRTTAVPTGNGVGKSYLAAGAILGFSASRPGSKTVVAAPTQAQLSGVVWSELEAAWTCAARNGMPLGGRVRPLLYELGDNWRVEGFGSGSVESKSGRHAGELLAVVDEASGVPSSVLEALDSLNPSKILYLGNPLRPEGKFYDVCELSADNPHVNVIRVPSLESPDIGLTRSPRGMADKTWLESSRYEYGEDSIWWLCHVLAQFPGTIAEGLLPIPWLNAAALVVYVPGGDRWIGVDIGEGTGGDPSVLVCRDDNGVIDHETSNRWDLETVAERTKAMSDRHEVEPTRVVYDQNGIGADFDNRLRTAGLSGAKGYKGSRSGGDKFTNLRSASAWGLRRRIDPARTTRETAGHFKIWKPQQPFALPKHLLDRYRPELQGLRYQLAGSGEIALENKEEFVKRLKKSPNFVDALIMTFAYPFT